MMEARLSPVQIGKRIMVLRKQKGFSQADIAQSLDIPRSSVAQIESGNRNVSVIELIKLSEVLGFSLDKLLASEYNIKDEAIAMVEDTPAMQDARVSIPRLKSKKFRNIILYILEQCAGKPNVGETVLYKLLYFSDFDFYELYEEHMTGARYLKLPYGPVPRKIESILIAMTEDGKLKQFITRYHGYPQSRYIPLGKADLTEMTAAEKDVIDKVIERFSDWPASAISEYSHKDMPWKATNEGDIIDYELALYREQPFSVRTYADEPEQP